MNDTNHHGNECRSYSEEKWVDWLMSSIEEHEGQPMADHLTTCPQCRSIVAHWQPILTESNDTVSSVENGNILFPSESVRIKLRAVVRRRGRWNALKSGLSRKKSWAASAAALFVLLVSIAGLYRTMNNPQRQLDHYVAVHEPDAVALLSNPETASYRVHPLDEELGEGYVWFNQNSREVLVLLEGFLPSNSHELQAWTITRSGHANLGMLHHYETDWAHLYMKNVTLEQVNNIVLTVEPSGGSRSPTSPDAFVFWIQNP